MQYDLTNGLATNIYKMFLNKSIEGIWHTGVVVGGHEYFYSSGLQRSRVGQTPFGAPHKIVPLGCTEIPDELIEASLGVPGALRGSQSSLESLDPTQSRSMSGS